MSDVPFLNRIRLACSRGTTRLFRNSVGQGWVGKWHKANQVETVTLYPGDVVIRKARVLHAGLTEGSGDLVGWDSREIKPEHVGQTWAVFVSLEAKEGTGRLAPAQRGWMAAVRDAGGIAEEVRSVEDAVRAVDRSSEMSRS